MTTWGELVVTASVWLALAGYLTGALHACAFGYNAAWSRVVRILWTLGFLALVVHVASAFHVHYEWSHRIALDETARRTADLTGRATGVGLYLNYLFALFWALDVALWWRDLETYRKRSTIALAALHGFLFFIVFNGTVVFADGPARWLGVAITMLLIGALVFFRRPRDVAP